MDDEPHPLDIPAFLKRDVNKKVESPNMANSDVSEDTPKAKAKAKPVAKPNGAVKQPVKAADKPKVKAAPKATVKASKGSEKPKAAKPKAETAKKDVWGFREGSAKSKAVEMYTSKEGATLEEVKEAVGSIQLNVLNSLEAEGHEVKRVKEVREGQRPLTRYFLKKAKIK